MKSDRVRLPLQTTAAGSTTAAAQRLLRERPEPVAVLNVTSAASPGGEVLTGSAEPVPCERPPRLLDASS
ncbi:poly(ADP-ribose) glycohydrolase domain-containing protein [Deinococcus sp. NW-56]|uniref:poly(ADP-ribose) glycohydrolase domain-containing protein n=1 Tax=Deinococcus sp. NW-56 TaxID=2080419 RepID=UPI000CF42C04